MLCLDSEPVSGYTYFAYKACRLESLEIHLESAHSDGLCSRKRRIDPQVQSADLDRAIADAAYRYCEVMVYAEDAVLREKRGSMRLHMEVFGMY